MILVSVVADAGIDAIVLIAAGTMTQGVNREMLVCFSLSEV